jgi:cytosine deaminase
MSLELKVRSAQLRGVPHLLDIGISGGRIVQVAESIRESADQTIDAAGRLVTPSFADPHCHIDKSFFGELSGRYDYQQHAMIPEESDLEKYRGQARSGMGDMEFVHPNVIPLWESWLYKERYTVDAVAERMLRALRTAASNGVLAMRMFCDVDTHAGLKTVEAGLRVREQLRAVMALQVVAFPQEGIWTDPGTDALMEQAMELGADVVGGIPFVEWTEADMQRHVSFCFALAAKFHRDIHFLCDDTSDPSARTLEMVAVTKLRTEFGGAVASSHNGALAQYPEEHRVRVIGLLRQAGVAIVANAHVNLLGSYTAVPELLRAGVLVAAGQDDIDNFYYPLGQPDPLEVAFCVVHAARLAYPEGMEQAFDMVSANAGVVMGLPPLEVAVGADANLVVHDARHVRDAIRYRYPRPYVISRGRVIAESNVVRRLEL